MLPNALSTGVEGSADVVRGFVVGRCVYGDRSVPL